MKRVKLILTAIAAIGIVGGALAFKAKKFGNTRYCFTTTTAAAALCVLTALNAEFLQIGTANIKYVTVQTGPCPPAVCDKTAKAIGL